MCYSQIRIETGYNKVIDEKTFVSTHPEDMQKNGSQSILNNLKKYTEQN